VLFGGSPLVGRFPVETGWVHGGPPMLVRARGWALEVHHITSHATTLEITDLRAYLTAPRMHAFAAPGRQALVRTQGWNPKVHHITLHAATLEMTGLRTYLTASCMRALMAPGRQARFGPFLGHLGGGVPNADRRC
jgi:hypothetical protein